MDTLFRAAKESIDSIFGDGYAAANPLLIDRWVQQEFRRTRGGRDCRTMSASSVPARTHIAAKVYHLLTNSGAALLGTQMPVADTLAWIAAELGVEVHPQDGTYGRALVALGVRLIRPMRRGERTKIYIFPDLATLRSRAEQLGITEA